jgi:hypothetical protein
MEHAKSEMNRPSRTFRGTDPQDIRAVLGSQKAEFDYWVTDVEGEIPEWLSGTLFRNGPGNFGTQTLAYFRPLFYKSTTTGGVPRLLTKKPFMQPRFNTDVAVLPKYLQTVFSSPTRPCSSPAKTYPR